MRVVEPHQLEEVRVKRQASFKKKRMLRASTGILLCIIAGGFVYFVVSKSLVAFVEKEPTETQQSQSREEANQVSAQEKSMRTFSGEEFKQLYHSIAYPNSQQLLASDPPEITGNYVADERIRQLAETRGYRLASVPTGAIAKIDGPRLDEGDDLLQPLAARAWESLNQAAERDNIPLSMLSAYRSVESQRDLFLERLSASGTNPSYIVAGAGDPIINQTLAVTAPPGYSRHHNGYTIDLWCEDGSSAFVFSRCYEWISADNYKNAKLHQWAPSYPSGADMQGPEPEPWEYVWVPESLLYK